MNFVSDNAGGVHPRIMAALAAANEGHVPAYGGDSVTRAAQDRLRELFDSPEAAVHFVASGTAANALSLSLLAPGWGK
ncbi:beta-eliminating lyase-related protein, partial [Paracoccus sp. PXZ]